MSELDLALLPAPTIIESLSYEATFSRFKARFQEIWERVRAENPDQNLPAYDMSMLETDPAMIIGEAESYRELNARARINDAARASLLAFATKGDLEHLAAFYGVTRLSGELDDRLKSRVILSIQGRSTGGPKERYKAIAMATDLRVKSVEVYRQGRSPIIHVAIFSTELNGIASPDLLAKVRAGLVADDVQLANDEFSVTSAVLRVINIAADIWILPNADEATVTRAEAELRAAWAKEQALGRDLAVSWWQSKLVTSGVHRVVPSPASLDVIAAPHEALALGNITLVLKGRAF